MVKVKEFCCGCTLRTGTLILAWSVMVWNCILFLNHLLMFLLSLQENETNSLQNLSPYSSIYFMAERILAVAVSILAIWAIQKKKARYLNGLFWYFCYVVMYYSLNALVVILDPALEEEMMNFKKFSLTSKEYKILFFTISLFITALASYFALVVKSSRDYALRNEAQQDDLERPDPTIVGYVNRA